MPKKAIISYYDYIILFVNSIKYFQMISKDWDYIQLKYKYSEYIM